jgi:benzoyl-CoA reductase/2-hydroxyglutaryl-CoA dehydratase subunit BcrC/BadD/HgdB
LKIIEQCGGDVVAFENCSGYKQAFTVDETKEPMVALAEQYLANPCSVMSPNPGRFQLLQEMVRDFAISGVVDLTWQACHTYNIEAFQVEEFIRATFGLPTLHLETDYAESDTEQLRVRIEAYLEMLDAGKKVE